MADPWPTELRLDKDKRVLTVGFDDGHDTGLYVWAYLHELGEHQEVRWRGYLADLAAKRLSR